MHYPIKTSRLQIKPLGPLDLDGFVNYRQDPEVARFQSWEPTYSKEDAFELIQSQLGVQIPDPGEWLQLGIHTLSSDELVGDLALHAVPESEKVFEIGFTISRMHQGKGFAKEAASAIIRHMLKEQIAKKFIATTDSRNQPSIRALSALGFKNDPERGWFENFKNEEVFVEYFETK